jgi:uncharacterized protein (DUF779 family)
VGCCRASSPLCVYVRERVCVGERERERGGVWVGGWVFGLVGGRKGGGDVPLWLRPSHNTHTPNPKHTSIISGGR